MDRARAWCGLNTTRPFPSPTQPDSPTTVAVKQHRAYVDVARGLEDMEVRLGRGGREETPGARQCGLVLGEGASPAFSPPLRAAHAAGPSVCVLRPASEGKKAHAVPPTDARKFALPPPSIPFRASSRTP